MGTHVRFLCGGVRYRSTQTCFSRFARAAGDRRRVVSNNRVRMDLRDLDNKTRPLPWCMQVTV
ncbi:hypothetical protein SXCC_01300 [Gluconacetobacter sp. SXCC-1]|nr:hypothetical protein SXCC_01300 [Gluconacetobacter sp. SXCC-1]